MRYWKSWGPDWHAAFSADLGNKTPLRFLAAGYADPHTVQRLGHTRLTRFLHRHSRGAWDTTHADTTSPPPTNSCCRSNEAGAT